MSAKIRPALTFACAAVGLMTAYIDKWFFLALAVGICGAVLGTGTLKSSAGISEKGMAAAGTLGCILAVCVGAGSILGYFAAYFAA